MQKIDCWTEYLNEYTSENIYPFSIKQCTIDESIMYRVIQQAVVTLLAIDFGDGETENRYKKLVSALIDNIVSLFDEEDKKQGYMKTFLDALVEENIAKGLCNAEKSLIINTRKLPSGNKNSTVLQRIFSNQLIKDVIPGVWNNQEGAIVKYEHIFVRFT